VIFRGCYIALERREVERGHEHVTTEAAKSVQKTCIMPLSISVVSSLLLNIPQRP